MARIRWSKELVVEEMRELYSKGEDFSYSNRTNKKLHCAARRYFGSLKHAVKMSGLDYSKVARKLIRFLDKSSVVAEIKRLNKSGTPLNTGNIIRANCALYSAGARHFGSWEVAIKAAGLDYSKIKIFRSLNSEEKVIAEIRKRHDQGLSLNGRIVTREDMSLYQTARKIFGKRGWQKALVAAGFDPDDVQKKFWTREKVRRQIYLLLRANASLYPTYLLKNNMGDLFKAGVRYFGNWKNAIESCGLNYSKIKRRFRKWTPRLILDEIKALKQRRVRLSSQNVRRLRHDLHSAATKYFGSWGQAVETAGFSYRQESINWSYKAWLKTLTPEQLETIDKQAREFALNLRRRKDERNRSSKATR